MAERYVLQPARWGAGGWAEASGAGAPEHLRVVTLNTWFDLYRRAERLAAQLRAWEDLRPDVIALQEVTDDLVRELARRSFVRERYAFPRPVAPLLGAHGYGVLLLVRPPVGSFTYTPLPSEMGRGVLTADLGGGVSVGTVHLESLEVGAARRVPQLKASQDALAHAPTAVLTGDFNFCHTYPEERAIRPPWADVWPLRRGEDPGWTCDTLANPMRERPGKPPKQRRYDRVLIRDDTHTWRVGEVDRVGTAPITPGVWMSDHFGLVADFTRRP